MIASSPTDYRPVFETIVHNAASLCASEDAVLFLLDGAEMMVHAQGQLGPELPRAVKGIKVQARGNRLHVLHAAGNVATPGTMIGAYLVHYTDGSNERIPIVYGAPVGHTPRPMLTLPLGIRTRLHASGEGHLEILEPAVHP